MINFCRAQVIPESLKDVIKMYETTGTKTAFGSDDQTRYARYCESFSKRLWLFAPGDNKGDANQRWEPTMKSRYDSFKNGCAANGGRLVEDWNGAGKKFELCTSEQKEEISKLQPSANAADFLCSNGELECRAP